MNKLQSPPPPRMLRTKEAAAYLSISTKKLRELVRKCKIRAVFGAAPRAPWTFDRFELDRHIEDNQLPKRRK